MTKPWPSFVTKDLGDSAEDEAEMMRRWTIYDREMKALIKAGGVHQDADGWWVETSSGELIGPDPELERPASGEDVAQARPFAEVFPELATSIRRSRGRPAVEHPKEKLTIRLSHDVVEHFRATGPGWQGRIDEALKKAAGLR